jgi:uncharacterized iron-regulated membrane protein
MKIPENSRPVLTAPLPGAQPISAEDAFSIAAAALPGTKPIVYLVPADPKDAYVIPLRFPEDLTPGGRSQVMVDRYSGKVIYVRSSRSPEAVPVP